MCAGTIALGHQLRELPAGEEACFTDASWGPNPNAVNDCDFTPTRIFKTAWGGMEEKWPAAYEILKNYTLSTDCVEELMNNEVVAKVLRVPTTDEFGLSQAYLNLTTFQEEMSEVLASHSFLGAHREADKNDEKAKADFAKKVLRLRPKLDKNSAERKTDEMTKQTDCLLEELDKIVNREKSK